MKYFKKTALFGFNKEKPEKPIKPFKTYNQKIESLPTYALKIRLQNLQKRVGMLDSATMPEDVKKAYEAKLLPITTELKNRGEPF